MEREVILSKINADISAILGKIKDNNSMNFSEDMKLFNTGLEFSSIDGVMLVVRLEETFGISWPDELLSFEDVLTIGQVANVVEKCLSKKEE